MKKKIREFANLFLSTQGLKIIRYYELIFLEDKLKSATEEIQLFFSEVVFKELKPNKKQIPLLMKLHGTGISEAIYVIYYLQKSMSFSGDVCEFGVGNGATSVLLADEIKKTKKKLWLFDSFQGLSKPNKKDILINDIFRLGTMDKYEGTMSYSIEEVNSRLESIHFPKSRIKIIPGFIEKTVYGKKLPGKICFAYVDFDLYEPILTALNFLAKRMSKGGFIVVDDYNFFSVGAKIAVDEFIKENTSFNILFPYKFAGHFCILEKKL